MLQGRGKISLRQAFYLFLIITFSPAIRLIPTFAADKAKQAAWLSALPAVIPMLAAVFMLNRVFMKYKDKSLMEAIYEIMGLWIGKAMVFLYFIWYFWLTALYLRYDVERLTSSTYPNIDPILFAIATIAMIAYILPKGITIIGRMAEILLPLIVLTFIILIIFFSSEIKIDSIIPVSSKDILPIMNGSIVSAAIGSYLLLIFFMGEFINDKEKLVEIGVKYVAVFIALISAVIFVTVGSLTSSVTRRLPIPFLVAVKQISVLGTIEKIESLVVGIWIFGDFILLSVFSFVTLNIFKSLFNLKDTARFLNIFLVLVLLIAMGMTSNRFDLENFSQAYLVHINNILGFVFPAIILLAGKIRNKI